VNINAICWPIRRSALLGVTAIVLFSTYGCGTADESRTDANPSATVSATEPSTATQQPTARESPAPTPEPLPSLVAFLSDRDGSPPSTYAVNVNGGDVRRIGGFTFNRGFEWSRDGSKVAIVECAQLPSTDSELYVMRADGSGKTNVSNHPDPDVYRCYSDAPSGGLSWSPDGGSIAFFSQRTPAGIYIVNADGTDLRFLTSGFLPAWSPNGDAILFVDGTDESIWRVSVYIIQPDGSNRRLLSAVPCGYSALIGGCNAEQLRWSPDGSMLAFPATAERPISFEAANHEIFVIRSDGSGLTNITNHPATDSNPDWVDCRVTTPGCVAVVASINPDKLNVRKDFGTTGEIVSQLTEGDEVCLTGASGFADGFRWWPVRSIDGREGWAAAFDPGQPDKPWLSATGATC